jgi:Ala-tRNA(Pro) deacylase
MEMLKLTEGRPSDYDKRLPKEQRCYDMLDRLGIVYSLVDHEHADTIEVCHEIEKTLGAHICKNLFLTNRQQTDFYLLLMPGDKPFKTKLLSKQIGTSRLSFGSPEHMLELLDITPGSVSILGLMNDEGKVKLLIDNDILNDEYIGCHPCINTTSLKIKTSDVLNKFLPEVGHKYEIVNLPWEIE